MNSKKNKAPVSIPNDQTQCVLIVEKDKALRSNLTRLLKRSGYHVTGTGNGKISLQLLMGALIDLVSGDLAVPVMNGIEMALQMTERFPRLPIIIISDGTTAHKRCAGQTMPNVKVFLRQTVTVDALISAVANVLSHRPRLSSAT